MWERSVHIPLGGENVVIYQLSRCLKNSVFNRILSIVCAMKFAFMICNRGKAKLMLLCSIRNFFFFCGIQHSWEVLYFVFFWF